MPLPVGRKVIRPGPPGTWPENAKARRFILPPGCTPQIRSFTVGTNDGSSATVSATSPGDTEIGDFLLFFHGNDFYTVAEMPTPTVSTGTPTVNAVTNGIADGGTNGAHIKTYWAVANTAGANTATVTETGAHDEEKCMVLYVFIGSTVDTANPIDDADNVAAASGATNVAPALQPTSAGDVMVIHDNSGGGASAASYTSPASMTEQYEIHVGGLSGVGATEVLASSGDTGTRTFTPSANIPYGMVTVAIRGLCEEVVTSQPVGVAVDGPSAQGTAIKVAIPVGRAVAGALAYGTAAKIATSTAGRAVAGALAYGTATKIASPSGVCAAGALARGVATKIATSTAGRSVAGALAYGTATQVVTPTPVGVCVGGALARGVAIKVTPETGVSAAGALARGTAIKVAPETGRSVAGALARGTAVKIGSEAGRSIAGASAQGTAAKTAIPSGRAVAGASTQGTATQPRQVSGVCAAGVSAYGVAVQGGDIVMDTQVLPLAQALRDCLCAWASVNPNPPQNCCFRVGTIAHDADLHTDLCCEGIAYVSIGDIWPSNVFPDEDSTQASKVCSPPSWGVELRAGIVRCAPTGTDTEMPSCDDWALAHIQTANDAQALRKTACCIRAWVNTNNPGMSVVIQRQVQTDPSGGCMERYFTVALQIPNCDC